MCPLATQLTSILIAYRWRALGHTHTHTNSVHEDVYPEHCCDVAHTVGQQQTRGLVMRGWVVEVVVNCVYGKTYDIWYSSSWFDQISVIIMGVQQCTVACTVAVVLYGVWFHSVQSN